jgi:hypothetical protein
MSGNSKRDQPGPSFVKLAHGFPLHGAGTVSERFWRYGWRARRGEVRRTHSTDDAGEQTWVRFPRAESAEGRGSTEGKSPLACMGRTQRRTEPCRFGSDEYARVRLDVRPKAGAVRGSSSRTDLCGGRPVRAASLPRSAWLHPGFAHPGPILASPGYLTEVAAVAQFTAKDSTGLWLAGLLWLTQLFP